MPARNAEKTIGMAIRSTLLAMGSHDELIVGLHNCTDKTVEKVGEFADRRLKTELIEDGGLAFALNQLIENSKHELLSRMDADDICLPWRFYMQRTRMGDHQFLFTPAVIFTKKNHVPLIFPQYPIPLKSDDIDFLLTFSNPLVHPTLLAKKTALLALRGYRDVAGEDLDLWLRASVAGFKFKRLAIPSILYRVSKSQLSRESWYSTGWAASPEIKRLRELLGAKPYKRRLGVFMLLEVMGFPRLKGFRRVALLRKTHKAHYGNTSFSRRPK